MTPSRQVLIALATYNEVQNLPPLVDAIEAALPAAHILVVDDNSPDGTGVWLRDRCRVDERLQAIHRPGKQGLGSATIAAMQQAIDNDYPLLVTMDADFSHDPQYIADLITAVEPDYDVAIGSRYIPGGGIVGWPWRRRAMSRLMNYFSRRWLGLSTHDCTGAFRCYRVEALRRLEFASFQSSGYAFCEEVLWWLAKMGARVIEVPIVFTDRQKGSTKLDTKEMIRALRTVVRLPLRRKLG